jgi:hypothetical protein
MRLSYELTLRDFKAAYRLHSRGSFSLRMRPYIWPTVTLLCIIGLIVFSVRHDLQIVGLCLSIGTGALVGAIGTPILRFINIRKGYKRLFPPHRKDRTATIDIDDERILREIPGMSELRLLWTGLFDFAKDDKVMLLYTNKDCFLMIPTAAMSSEQQLELSECVARHLPKGKR